MFAVPGWNLPQKVETQKDVPESSRKKRKRQHEKRDDDTFLGRRQIARVTSSNEHHAEDKLEIEDATPWREDAEARTRDMSVKQQQSKISKPKKQKSTKNLNNVNEPSAPPGVKSSTTLTPLQSAMAKKLASARFRHLNETLYTTPSTSAMDLFNANPTFFTDYHTGFRQQVTAWPTNPVDGYITAIQSRSLQPTPMPLPRTAGTCTIADLGCGDAALAASLAPFSSRNPRANLRVLSYDLAAPNGLVTKADIRELPLGNASVNVAVFCLALMGTNWTEFVDEAWRVLHWKGELWIAEIKSRFVRPRRAKKQGPGPEKGKKRVEHSVGKKRMVGGKVQDEDEMDEAKQRELMVEVDGNEDARGEQTDVGAFVDVLKRRGFSLLQRRNDEEWVGKGPIDLSNKMFVKMYFIKDAAPSRGKNVNAAAAGRKTAKPTFVDEGSEVSEQDEASVLKPCLYKVR